MSMRYRGGYISATLPTVTGQQSTPGAWTLTQQMQYQAAGTWPVPPFIGWYTGVTTSGSTNAEQGIIVASTGDVYITDGDYANNAYIVKTDASGTVQWRKRYYINSTTNYYVNLPAGVELTNGNIVFVGRFFRGSSSQTKPLVLQIDPSGAVVAAVGLLPSGAGDAYATGVAADSANNIYVSSWTGGTTPTTHYVAKLPSNLSATTWAGRVYGGVTYNNIALSPDGNTVYLSGYDSSNTPGNYIGSFTSSGTRNTFYGVYAAGSSNGRGVGGISTDSSGNVYCIGYTLNNSYVIKLDSILQPTWSRETPYTQYAARQYTKTDADGNVYASAGYATGSSAKVPTFITKFTSSGTSLFSNAVAANYGGYGGVNINSTGTKLAITSVAAYALNTSGNLNVQLLPATGTGYGVYGSVSPLTFGYTAYTSGPTFSTPGSSTYLTTLGSLPTASTSVSVTALTVTVTNLSLVGTSTTINYAYPQTNGSAVFAFAGTYTWIAPAGVTSVSAVCIGGGGGGASGSSGSGGGGGGLGYKNNISVTPGSSYTVVVGAGGSGGQGAQVQGTNGGQSYFIANTTVAGNGGTRGFSGGGGSQGGTYVGDGGGDGGNGGIGNSNGGGGGGAGGYSGTGGNGGGNGLNQPGNSGGGGGAGGGGSGGFASGCTYEFYGSGADGGSVGVLGQGTGGTSSSGAGNDGSSSGPINAGGGGRGGGYQSTYNCCTGWVTNFLSGNPGKDGAVRIVWGTSRTFPTTNVGVP